MRERSTLARTDTNMDNRNSKIRALILNYHHPPSSTLGHHIQLTMGPPNGAEHAKPKPVVVPIIKKCVQARGGEDEPPSLLEAPEMTTNVVGRNESTYHIPFT